jgi:hypothetical protein
MLSMSVGLLSKAPITYCKSFFLGRSVVFYQEIAYNLSREKMLTMQRGKGPLAVPKEPRQQGRLAGPV